MVKDYWNRIEKEQRERVIKENLESGIFISGNSIDTWKCPLCDRKYDFEDNISISRLS